MERKHKRRAKSIGYCGMAEAMRQARLTRKVVKETVRLLPTEAVIYRGNRIMFSDEGVKLLEKTALQIKYPLTTKDVIRATGKSRQWINYLRHDLTKKKLAIRRFTRWHYKPEAITMIESKWLKAAQRKAKAEAKAKTAQAKPEVKEP